ncbi:glycosyltransferase [Methylomonas sp. MO1]|uniref:glycosyltransferase n=1 Tax=unclassified Methylomonas TaxID=2608980 RepID=UPI00047C168D|nr:MULTISPECIES: glycosyltransferase [unclassified Methylomonas]MDT4292314.1 glycosyltransferase [Methylomonas sp. MO1]
MKTQSPLASVILPVYNGKKFIRDAVHSILTQSHINLELLIVDDGSTDESTSIIKELSEKDNRIRFFQQKNSGVAGARNLALREAKGEYIGFIDQDDIWLTDKLESQITYFKQNPEAVFLHGNIEYIDDQLTPLDKSLYPWETNASGHCFERLFVWNAIAIQTVCFKRKCMETVGFLREEVPGVDDYDYWLRFSRFFPIDYLDKTFALYRFHGENESHKWHLQDIKRAKVLEGILQDFPDIYLEIGKTRVNNQLSALYREIAIEFIRKNNNKEARTYSFKAFVKAPFKFENIFTLLMSLIPNQVLSSLRWYISKINPPPK